jgi:hypothetical protein
MWLSGTRLPNINRICFLHWTTNEPFPYEAVSATVESAQTELVIIIGRYKQHFCVANRADSVTRSSYNLCTTLGFRRWLKCSPACPEYHRRQRPRRRRHVDRAALLPEKADRSQFRAWELIPSARCLSLVL